MFDLYTWERSYLVGGGERLALTTPDGFRPACIVHLPGTLWRVYWQGGAMEDFFSEQAAVWAVERKVIPSA
jgi:hypothetical protein